MIIFARKHFAPNSAGTFALLINMAVYLRAGAAVLARFMHRMLLPLMDGAVLYGGMVLLIRYWEQTIKYIHGG